MSNKLKRAIIATKIILFITTFGIIIWDVSIALGKLWEATISNQITSISSHFIFIPFVWGVLLAHFFYSKLGKKLFNRISKLRYMIWISVSAFILFLCLVNLIKEITFVTFLENNLFIPAIFGQVLGLFWYQNKHG